MNRPDPIQYAERLYAAIRAANFSPLSFLAFGNAVKDGVDLRRMPRIAVEPFMRVVGDMLDLEVAATQEDIINVDVRAASEETPPLVGTVATATPLVGEARQPSTPLGEESTGCDPDASP